MTPPNPSIADGTTEQFTATGTFSDQSTQDLTATASWTATTLSGGTATITAGGLATGTGVGTVTITATAGDMSGSDSLTVTSATLVSIAVTPPAPSIADGTAQQFTATGTFSDQTTQDLTATSAWTETTLAGGTATITAGGLATGTGAGTVTITATSGDISGNATLTVTSATLVSIAVTPPDPSIANGTTQQFTATGTFSDQTAQDLTATSSWTATTLAGGTATITAGGLATGTGVGTVTIAAAFGGKSGTATLTVTPATLSSIAVTPPNPSIADGTTEQFTATGTFSDQSTQDLTATASWTATTLAGGTATISPGGLATGTGAGTVTIAATSGGKSGSATLTVTAPPPLWTWMSGSNTTNAKGIYGATASSVPGARYGAVSRIDTNGQVWLFGGYGIDSAGTSGYLNDLWKFNGIQWASVSGSSTTGATGTYGQLGVAAASNVPGARVSAVSWIDASGQLWLFGGYAGGTAFFNDLWKFDGADWTWVSGSKTANASGSYGQLGVAAASNVPGARVSAVSWIDASGQFWLFGGSNGNNLNDLWKFDGTYWTWVSGSSTTGATGNYGQPGVTAASNVPGARVSAASWIDASGQLWLFGGRAGSSRLNDLWKFDGTNWTWMSGSSTTGATGNYGQPGVTAPSNVPGARYSAASWIDTSGQLWLFGGYGNAAATFGWLNDLWKFDGTNWTWASGSDMANASGSYGQLGVAMPSNVPGARSDAASWIDASGQLWLFGGYLGGTAYINDVWLCQP